MSGLHARHPTDFGCRVAELLEKIGFKEYTGSVRTGAQDEEFTVRDPSTGSVSPVRCAHREEGKTVAVECVNFFAKRVAAGQDGGGRGMFFTNARFEPGCETAAGGHLILVDGILFEDMLRQHGLSPAAPTITVKHTRAPG